MNTSPQPEPGGDAAPEPHPTHGIGERLARLRGARGVKVSALARAVGVSPSLISQIERGQSRPSVSTLFELAQALDVPVDAFFRDAEADAGPASPPAPAAARAAPEPAERAPLPPTVREVSERPVPVPDR